MLSKMLGIRRTKSRSFQVLFLRNDATQDVEVHEVKQVDFLTVQERLELGESVFITSKRSQKVGAPKNNKLISKGAKTRLVHAFSMDSR
jgi:hypothetical protein